MITAGSGRVAVYEAVHALLNEGREVHPRGLKTWELEPACFVIHDPSDVVPTGINREKLHPPIGVAEGLQLVAGVSTPELLTRIAPNFKMFLNSTGQFDGAYGPRARSSLLAAHRRLKLDEDSRQAVASIWGEEDALREGSKDYPCTLDLHFMIRGGRLNLHVTMRSNDVWWGVPYDFMQFAMCQLTMANCLNLAPGMYTHKANSLHLYERDLEAAERLHPADERNSDFDRWRLGPIGHPGMGWDEVQDRALSLLRGQEPPTMTGPEFIYLLELERYTNGKAT